MAPGPLGVGPSRGGGRQGPAGVCLPGGGASQPSFAGALVGEVPQAAWVGLAAPWGRWTSPSPPISLLLVWPVCP